MLSGYFVAALSIAVNLWLIPFTLRFVSREEYAFFVVVGDVLVWLNLFDFGTSASLRAQAARLSGAEMSFESDQSGRQSEINRLASNAFFAQTIAALFVFAVGSVFALTLPALLFSESGASAAGQASSFDHTIVVGLLVAAAGFGFGARAFAALLAAHQLMHVNNFLQAGQSFLRLLLAVCLLVAGGKLLALATAHAVATTVFAALTVWWCYRKLGFLRISRRFISRADLLGKLMNLAVWFNLGNLAGTTISYLDRFVAATLVSLESVTTLTLTGRAYFFATMLLSQLVGVAMPALGQLAGREDRVKTDERAKIEDRSQFEDRPKFYAAYRRFAHLVTGASVVAAASIFAGNHIFVTRWVGVEHYGGVWLDAGLAVALVAASWTLPQRAVLVADLVARPQAFARITEALLNVIFSIVLTMWYGLLGVVVSTTLAIILSTAWRLPALAASSVFGVRVRRLLADVWLPLLFPVLSITALSVLVRLLLPETASVWVAFAAMGSVFLCGVGLLWKFSFEPELRAQLLGVLAGVRGIF